MTGFIDPDQLYQQPERPQTFFFYDLETSGLNPREDRIMQFAGQRTDMNLDPVGEPVNILVRMSDDTLPSPQAIMVTKITPQSTQADGMSEAEFCRYLTREIFTPGTIATGYNSVRFDDEFIRHLFWRNFYDPYEWQWKDGRSKWDLLDVVRLTRALRPEGIEWPWEEKVHPETKEVLQVATNRLELITKLNGIEHLQAHDALSDVVALIEVAKLIKKRQPKLFDFLFEMREKQKIKALVNLDDKKPFVYASGRYKSEFNKTTVAFPLTAGRNGNVLVFDLRYNLDELLEEERTDFYPVVKELAYNKCPAVAPIGVLEGADGWSKIQLSPETVVKNREALLSHPEFAERMRSEIETRPEWPEPINPESALYAGFLPDQDRSKCLEVRSADASKLADLHPEFIDERLDGLLLHYKARNFPEALSQEETELWEKYRIARLMRQTPAFLEALQKISAENNAEQGFLIEELTLWLQSLQAVDY